MECGELKERLRQRQNADERRQQILEEASFLIGERGYYGFGLRELGQRCGLGNAGLLHHFGSKEGLLIALLAYRDMRDSEVMGLGRFGEKDCGPPLALDDLRAMLRAAVVRNCTQPELIRLYALLQSEALNETHPAFEFFLSREVGIVEGLRRHLLGHVPEPRSTARQILAAMLGLEQQWIRSGQAFDLVTEWDRAAERLLSG